MTLFNRDPYSCHDASELQQWVAMLQEMLLAQKEISRLSREQGDLLKLANQDQGDQLECLQQQVKLLRQRLDQYEVAFSAEYHNHVRRLN
ncbi:hypothetical protein GCM10028805_36480 [Spirosoma harenae]